MAVKIGGADGGGNFVKKKQFKIKDGDNIYRILPSLGFGGKEPNGKPFQFYNVHFGYKNSEGKIRVFQSPEVKNRDTRMIEKRDAAKERIETLKAAFEEAKKTRNKSEAERLFPLVGGQKPMYNMDNNHHCNAINQQGEIGILKIRHKCKLALDAVLKQLRAKGIEPLGADNGRFFVFNRTGTALETTFTITVLKRTVTKDGEEFEQDVVHKLTPDIINRLEAEAGDLSNLYKRPTSEEVDRIVSQSDLLTGRSPAVDEIFDRKAEKTETLAEEEPEAEDEHISNLAKQAAPASAPMSKSDPVPAQSLSQPAPAAVKLESTPAPKVAAPAVSEMSDEDFLKSLGA